MSNFLVSPQAPHIIAEVFRLIAVVCGESHPTETTEEVVSRLGIYPALGSMFDVMQSIFEANLNMNSPACPTWFDPRFQRLQFNDLECAAGMLKTSQIPPTLRASESGTRDFFNLERDILYFGSSALYYMMPLLCGNFQNWLQSPLPAQTVMWFVKNMQLALLFLKSKQGESASEADLTSVSASLRMAHSSMKCLTLMIELKPEVFTQLIPRADPPLPVILQAMLSDKRRQTLKGAAYKLLTVASMRPGALLGQVISHSETLTEIFDELDDSSSVLRTRVAQIAFHLCKHAGPEEKAVLVENNIIPKLFSASVSFKASSDYLRRLTQYQGTVFDFTMVSFCFQSSARASHCQRKSKGTVAVCGQVPRGRGR